ncbi:MAG: hypothetical protein Kow0047_21450 [Anaerolineae bacterium]
MQFLPFLFGSQITLFVYLGFALFIVLGIGLPIEAWVAALLMPLVGLILQLASRRVIYIRAYYTVVAGLFSLVYGSLLWSILATDQSHRFKLFAGLIIGAMLILIGIGSYRANLSKSYSVYMPHGPVGTLDERTGLVDPSTSPPHIQEEYDKAQRQIAQLLQWAPLTAGLSILLVRSLSLKGHMFLIALVALVCAAGGAFGVGGFYFYYVAARNWEREHGKPIYVKWPSRSTGIPGHKHRTS